MSNTAHLHISTAVFAVSHCKDLSLFVFVNMVFLGGGEEGGVPPEDRCNWGAVWALNSKAFPLWTGTSLSKNSHRGHVNLEADKYPALWYHGGLVDFHLVTKCKQHQITENASKHECLLTHQQGQGIEAFQHVKHQRRPCGSGTCGADALSYTEPAKCFSHLKDCRKTCTDLCQHHTSPKVIILKPISDRLLGQRREPVAPLQNKKEIQMWAFWEIARVREVRQKGLCAFLTPKARHMCLVFPATLQTKIFMSAKHNATFISGESGETRRRRKTAHWDFFKGWLSCSRLPVFGFNGFGEVAYKRTLTLLTWDLFWTLHARSRNSGRCFKLLSSNWLYCCCPTAMCASILWVTTQRRRTVHPWKWAVR